MQTVVLCHGCWDVLHVGHIRHLRAAKALGTHLTVSVTADRFVNKGEGRPIFPAAQRAEMLKALRFVDSVVINEDANAVDTIHLVRPDIYCKGIDYVNTDVPNLKLEIAAVEALGGVFRTTDTRKWSSTEIIAKMRAA